MRLARVSLERCAGVGAAGGSPEKPPLDESGQNRPTCVGIEAPEPGSLSFRKLETWHLVVLALNSYKDWRFFARSLWRERRALESIG